jgi:hypothetical protein
MLADELLDLAQPGDTVLDPLLGSHSTLIAAHRFGRAGVRLRVAITCRTFLARRMQGCHIAAIDFRKRFRGRLGRPL